MDPEVRIRDLIHQNFWGEITIKYRSGQPVLITKTEEIPVKILDNPAVSRKYHQRHDTLEQSHGNKEKDTDTVF